MRCNGLRNQGWVRWLRNNGSRNHIWYSSQFCKSPQLSMYQITFHYLQPMRVGENSGSLRKILSFLALPLMSSQPTKRLKWITMWIHYYKYVRLTRTSLLETVVQNLMREGTSHELNPLRPECLKEVSSCRNDAFLATIHEHNEPTGTTMSASMVIIYAMVGIPSNLNSLSSVYLNGHCC